MFNTNPDVNKSNNADDKVEYWVVTQDKWVMEMIPTTFYVSQITNLITYPVMLSRSSLLFWLNWIWWLSGWSLCVPMKCSNKFLLFVLIIISTCHTENNIYHHHLQLDLKYINKSQRLSARNWAHIEDPYKHQHHQDSRDHQHWQGRKWLSRDLKD